MLKRQLVPHCVPMLLYTQHNPWLQPFWKYWKQRCFPFLPLTSLTEVLSFPQSPPPNENNSRTIDKTEYVQKKAFCLYCTDMVTARDWGTHVSFHNHDYIFQILTVPCSNRSWHWLRHSGLSISSKSTFSACSRCARSVPSYRCLHRTSSSARLCWERTQWKLPCRLFNHVRFP